MEVKRSIINNLSDNSNVIFYVVTALIVVIVKLFYNVCDVSRLLFILFPVTKLTEIFTGINFYFEQGIGYVSYDGSIVIGKSCVGLNFFIIALCMFVFSFIKVFSNIKAKVLVFLVFIASSYIATIVVNFFRIAGSILILKAGFLSGIIDKDILHKATGILFYFFFLVVCYYLAHKFIVKVSDQIGKAS